MQHGKKISTGASGSLAGVGVSILVLSVGALIGSLKVIHVLAAAATLLILGGCIAVGAFIAAKFGDERRREDTEALHTRAFTALVMGSPAPPDTGGPFKLISQDYAVSLEGYSREIWVYAYDLGWEDDTDVFRSVMIDNLARGCSYQFLLPDDDIVLRRAKDMILRLRDIDKLATRIACRVRPVEAPFAEFAINIYNPKFGQIGNTDDGACTEVVVLMPRYADVHSELVPFLCVTGSAVRTYRDRFGALWDAAGRDRIDVSRVLQEGGL